KTCPHHGRFSTIIWRGPPSYDAWAHPGDELPARSRSPGAGKGCPFECGLCRDHRQQTCCVVLEVTDGCDLRCRFCFAAAGTRGRDPDLGAIERRYRALISAGGPCNIQLSGGEPTLRDDLPAIVALGRSTGHQFIQLNTNGLRISRDPRYLRALKEAGLGCVFLQFDGTTDAAHEHIRGAALARTKAAAIENCAEAGVGVVLAPTVVPGVNDDQLGAIVAFALERAPVVRGVHFQPVSFFGRYPRRPGDRDRITIPEVMRALERQTDGAIRVSHLRPATSENAHCSFHGNFILRPDGTLGPFPAAEGSKCCPGKDAGGKPVPRASCCGERSAGAKRAREFVARHWAFPDAPRPGREAAPEDSLDAFLRDVGERSFCVSGMAFQDVWNIDLGRVRDCHLHVASLASGDQRIVPFCAYNLTDAAGKSLHRRGATT
ncbi:MAG TPA: radical SAM protein, partial [Anaeromyxobacteraceae bacterium]|nr:radical SAM protein [Anaeromyxobacteraceae bacterium]